MPTPKEDETKKEFVSRCIPIVTDDGTAEDNEQATAICFSMWRDAQKKEKEMGKNDNEVERGLYLVEPHGKLIYERKKTSIVKAREMELEGEWIIVSKDKAYGVAELEPARLANALQFDEKFDEHRVTKNERNRWWEDKDQFYLYGIKEFEAYDEPRKVVVPNGVKSMIEVVEFVDQEKGMDKTLKALLGNEVSVEDALDEIRRAFDKTFPRRSDTTGTMETVYRWIVATYENAVIVDTNSEFFRVPYVRIGDGEFAFAVESEWEPVEKFEEWIAKSKAIKAKEGEKAGRRIRGDKVDILKTLQTKFNDVMDTIKDLISFADYDDKKPQSIFEKGKDVPRWGIKTLELKDGRTGLLTWTTNAFKDLEGEIFSTEAIVDLVERYSDKEVKGEYKFWHIPGSKFGDILWQGVSGRFLAEVGVFDETKVGQAFKDIFTEFPDGHPEVAPEGWGTSHGFMYKSDDREDGVYEWFDKEETSVLPASAAANPYNPKLEVLKMDDKEKAALSKLAGDEIVDLIETTGEDETKRLEELDVEHKSKSEKVKEGEGEGKEKKVGKPAVEKKVVDPKSEKEIEDEGAKEEGGEPVLLTLDDVEPAFQGFAKALIAINERLDIVDASLKALAESDEKKIEEKVELTPKESLKSIAESAIGKKETLVRKNASLKDDGPKETEPNAESATGIPVLDSIKARNLEQERPGIRQGE